MVGGAAGWTLWQAQRGRTGSSAIGSPRTREWPQTPWRNARPGIEYVGDEECARCHAAIAETFRRHPMGRSLAPVATSSAPGVVEQPDSTATFDAGLFRFSIERREGRQFHKESRRDEQGRVVAEVEMEVKYALGSGTRGISYLVDHDGRLFQSPIAWYGQKQRWDLSPGYQRRNVHFDRMIEPQCLFCHANRVEPIELTVNRYKEPIFQGYAIGCERCHGPGGLHVRGQEVVGDRDLTIVNPRHLEPALREAVCQQCHLQGDYRIERPGRNPFDYRPGLPLSTFMTVLERTNKRGNKAVGHVEQMHASRCFRESGGQLSCISCHDPHQVPAPAEKTAYFRHQCLNCHEQQRCSLPDAERLARSRDDNCIQCHMPVSPNTDVVHNATTDHRILRAPQTPLPEPPEPPAAGPALVLFHADQLDARQREAMSRELGIGLALEGRRSREPALGARLAQAAVGLLDQALAQQPDDLVALRLKAQALSVLGRSREGMQIDDMVLKQAPDYEQALDERVSLALKLSDRQAALAPALRAVAVNPWYAEFHERLAHCQLGDAHWSEALQEADEALRLDPFLNFARQFRIQCLLHDKDAQRAGEELKTLIELYPSDRGTLQLWFARERQRFGS